MIAPAQKREKQKTERATPQKPNALAQHTLKRNGGCSGNLKVSASNFHLSYVESDCF